MGDTSSSLSGVASRYATAVFEISKEAGSLKSLEADIASLSEIIGSDGVKDLISSPVYSRADQESAIVAIGKKAGLSQPVLGTLDLMAKKRRLFILPQLLQEVDQLIKAEKDVAKAEVAVASELTEAQKQSLQAALSKNFGKEIELDVSIDPSLIGGMVVKVGSKMVDTSIKSKLGNLQNIMKEVG